MVALDWVQRAVLLAATVSLTSGSLKGNPNNLRDSGAYSLLFPWITSRHSPKAITSESQQYAAVANEDLQPSATGYRGKSYNGGESHKGHEGYKKSYQDEKGYKGHKGHNADKGYKGSHYGDQGKSAKSGYHGNGDKHRKGHEDKHKYYSDEQEGKKGKKGHHHGSKGHHNKGYKDQGHKNVYHKEEYSLHKKFYDDGDDDKYQSSYDDFDAYFDAHTGKNYHGGQYKGGKHRNSHDKKSHHGRGAHHADHRGHKGHYGEQDEYGHKSTQGKKGGHKDHYGENEHKGHSGYGHGGGGYGDHSGVYSHNHGNYDHAGGYSHHHGSYGRGHGGGYRDDHGYAHHTFGGGYGDAHVDGYGHDHRNLQDWSNDSGLVAIVEGKSEFSEVEIQSRKRIFRENLANADYSEHIEVVGELLAEFGDTVALQGDKLGLTNVLEHKVNLEKGTNPIYIPAYRIPFKTREQVEKEVNKWEEEGIIRPSVSPYNLPLLAVPKKDGSVHTFQIRTHDDFREFPTSSDGDDGKSLVLQYQRSDLLHTSYDVTDRLCNGRDVVGGSSQDMFLDKSGVFNLLRGGCINIKYNYIANPS
ncbi:histidine-rich glycoprotein-like [Macrobrachium nipponense]|uniref:histidine-rich glycoprotein-like n=1 Tax=Macrobrachium nipponense TaxID=159736 RepID=UPI0030C864E6